VLAERHCLNYIRYRGPTSKGRRGRERKVRAGKDEKERKRKKARKISDCRKVEILFVGK